MTQLLPRSQICCHSSKTRQRNVVTQLSVFLMATEAPPLSKLHLYVLLYTSRHSHAVNFEVNSSRFISDTDQSHHFNFQHSSFWSGWKSPHNNVLCQNQWSWGTFPGSSWSTHHRWHFALNRHFSLAEWSWPVAPRLQLELTRFVQIWFWSRPHTAQSHILT